MSENANTPSNDKSPSPATNAKADPKIRTSTPENAQGKLNPSAPGNAGTTPGTNAELG